MHFFMYALIDIIISELNHQDEKVQSAGPDYGDLFMRLRAIKMLVLVFLPVLFLPGCDQNEESRATSKVISTIRQKMARDSLPGAALAKKKCATCHYFDRNLAKVGPALKGILGRAPTISGVPFKIWDEASLDQWIEDPAGIKPDTLMAIPGIKSAKERTEIIEYLKQF